MGRMPRIHIENALYFIISKGDHDANIFKEGSDYNMYLDLLKKNKEQHKFKLFGYCLMANQINMLIELTSDTIISQIMHGLNSTYTKYFNSKYKTSGHLFQERYKMTLVEKEPNMLGMSAYINLLPKVSGATHDAITYPYSSYASYLYIGEKGRTASINIDNEIREVTGYLKGINYERYISETLPADLERIEDELNKKAIIGSDEFMNRVKAKIEIDKQKAEEASSGGSDKIKKLMKLGIILVAALSVFSIALYARTIIIKENIKREIARKDSELKKKLVEEKQMITKDLTERYHADMVSFMAMTKRLEIEKKKTSELESELKGQKPKK